MKVAIHNAAGAAGARLVETFHLTGTPTPVALASDHEGLVRAGRLPVTLRRFEPASISSLASAFSGCSAAVFIPADEETPDEIVTGTKIFAEAARQARLRRVVMVSDIAVHPPDPEKSPDEDPPLPQHEHGSRPAALAAAESALLEKCAGNPPSACVLRAGWLYGARVREFADLAAELTTGVTAASAGNSPRQGLHVDNLVAAVRAALSAKLGDRHVFVVTDTGDLTCEAFRRAVSRELGIRRDEATPLPVPVETRKNTRWNHVPSRAERILGYRPAVDVNEGIRRSCAWWKFTRE